MGGASCPSELWVIVVGIEPPSLWSKDDPLRHRAPRSPGDTTRVPRLWVVFKFYAVPQRRRSTPPRRQKRRLSAQTSHLWQTQTPWYSRRQQISDPLEPVKHQAETRTGSACSPRSAQRLALRPWFSRWVLPSEGLAPVCNVCTFSRCVDIDLLFISKTSEAKFRDSRTLQAGPGPPTPYNEVWAEGLLLNMHYLVRFCIKSNPLALITPIKNKEIAETILSLIENTFVFSIWSNEPMGKRSKGVSKHTSHYRTWLPLVIYSHLCLCLLSAYLSGLKTVVKRGKDGVINSEVQPSPRLKTSHVVRV